MSFRYNPFEEMDRLFEQTRRAMGTRGVDGPALDGPSDSSTALSASDANLGLDRTDEGLVVTADLPGFEREDLDLWFEDGVLTIHGEVDVMDSAEGPWQRQHRSVHEQISIPGAVVEGDVDASYRNGVLEVHLPTEEEPEDDAHRIDIE